MGTKAENRKRYGVSGKPTQATRVLAKPMEHDFNGKKGISMFIINDQTGTFVGANSYDGELGKNFTAEGQTHTLPAASDEKWKIWRKRGYVEASVQDYPCLEFIGEAAQA